jgi:uncharacterized protein HemY
MRDGGRGQKARFQTVVVRVFGLTWQVTRVGAFSFLVSSWLTHYYRYMRVPKSECPGGTGRDEGRYQRDHCRHDPGHRPQL